jgi:colanic acid/amylovoran biosynthesis glycosyltransferase
LNSGIRLAYLVSQYPTAGHAFILREVRKLRELGFDIHVASIRAPDRPPGNLTAEELDEYRRTRFIVSSNAPAIAAAHIAAFCRNPIRYLAGLFFALTLRGPIGKNFFYFVEAVIVGQWMRGAKLSHVHIHFSSTVGLIAQRVFPITTSVTMHGSDEFLDPRGFHLAEKIAQAKFITTVSSYGRAALMNASNWGEWNKIELLPLGIDPEIFQPRPFRDNPAVFEILCVGRLVPVKALHVLLESISLLKERKRAVRLRLVGDGPERAELERDVSERGLGDCVRFEGRLDQDRLREVYRDADIFVLPSFLESLPVVLMEAMATEIPCVATWVGGVADLIRHEIDGLLIPPGNAGAVAAAIERLRDDPELRKRLGAAGRLRVLDKYDLSKNTAALADAMRRRLGPGSV